MDGPKPSPIFRGRVDEQGKLQPREVGRFAGHLAKLRGKDVEIIVRRESKTRSQNSNRFYWGVIIAAGSEWSGYEPEEFHVAMKLIHLPRKKLVLPTGEEVETVATTHDLSTEAFGEYINRVVRWLAEQGVVVPLSSEVA